MSAFECPVIKIARVEKHPNADALDLVYFNEFACIVGKDSTKVGDYAVYIPEGAVVPEWLLEKIGLKGRLAGTQKNRVKAVKLRGVVSQGILYPLFATDTEIFMDLSDVNTMQMARSDIDDGDGYNAAFVLGIVKYEPPLPSHMSGQAVVRPEYAFKYDIENLKKYPNVLTDTDVVVMTEKLHGTFCGVCYWPGMNDPDLFGDGCLFAFSKGLGAKGLIFKNTPDNDGNVYVQTLKENFLDRLYLYQRDDIEEDGQTPQPIYILGEVFGRGVQDLTYGMMKPTFRVFDIYVGKPGQGRYLDPAEMADACKRLGLETVPLLYVGEWSREIADKLRDGKTTFNGFNIREGIVIRLVKEEERHRFGRVILKHVSDDYLMRKGEATEFN